MYKRQVKRSTNNKSKKGDKNKKGLRYKIQHRRLKSSDFYTFDLNANGLVTITLNTDHSFYDRVYEQLKDEVKVDNRQAIECFLLAAVRAEIGVAAKSNTKAFAEFRRAWSDALEVFLDA